MNSTSSKTRDYTPERMSRQGEITAWGLTFVILILMWFLITRTGGVSIWIVILFGLFLLSGLGISLSNWMDSRTNVKIKSEGVVFTNGLRNVSLDWDEIETIKVIPAPRDMKRIQVSGNRKFFEIRTLTKFEYKGKQQGASGFSDGEEILQKLVENSGLVKEESANIYYYVRK